jgi:hypothetical protein
MERYNSIMRAARYVISVGTFAVALVGAAASPAAAEDCVPVGSEGSDNVICGTVKNSDNTAVVGVLVTATFTDEFGMPGDSSAFTDGMGFFKLESLPAGTITVVVNIPPPSVVTPPSIEVTVELDDMGNPTGTPNQNFVVSLPSPNLGIGTGTPGYWKNHPEAWPAAGVTVGGVFYAKTSAPTPGNDIWDAIAKMGKVSGDKTYSMFAALVSAILNTTPAAPGALPPNNPSCISATIASANDWLADHPVGSGVKASSGDWQLAAQEWHQLLDDYNNGKMCAPHRN